MDFIVIPLHKVTKLYFFNCIYLYRLRLLLVVYLAVITTLGVLTAAVVLLRHFRTPAYRWMRTGLFLALGLFGIVPTLHGICLYGVSVFAHPKRERDDSFLGTDWNILGYDLVGISCCNGNILCKWCIDLCMQVSCNNEWITSISSYNPLPITEFQNDGILASLISG